MMNLPTSFGRYLLLEKIAMGGMAEIFRAKLLGVEGFEKTVVIKRILPYWSERREFITMLVDEAKVLVHLNHPNIVQVYELGRVGNTYFISMEYVEGMDLRLLLHKLESAGKTLPQEISMALMAEGLRGLHYAHTRSLKDKGHLGLIHRDISPQNILLSSEGIVKITDFGIAKAVTQTHETQTGVLKGKYAYMSPEQALGRPLDSRSDLFSFGVVFYELLFHKRLFPGRNDLEILDQVRKGQIVWPEGHEVTLFPGVKEILTRALSRDPGQRFTSAEEFREDLERCFPFPKKESETLLAGFLGKSFPQEISQWRRRDLEEYEITHKETKNTRVFSSGSLDTISVINTTTELPKKTLGPEEALKRGEGRWVGYLPLILAGIWILIAAGITLYYLSFFRNKENTGSSSGVTSPGSFLKKDPFPVVSLPENVEGRKLKISPTPSTVSGESLRVRVSPAEASIKATYPGGEKSAKGKLILPNLALGDEVTVRAFLTGYVEQTQVFKIGSSNRDVTRMMILKKLIPKMGSIQINAVPWGKVQIPGILEGKETPVHHNGIPEGKYSLTVTNPALNKSVETTTWIRDGRITRCHADFEGKASLACR